MVNNAFPPAATRVPSTRTQTRASSVKRDSIVVVEVATAARYVPGRLAVIASFWHIMSSAGIPVATRCERLTKMYRPATARGWTCATRPISKQYRGNELLHPSPDPVSILDGAYFVLPPLAPSLLLVDIQPRQFCWRSPWASQPVKA